MLRMSSARTCCGDRYDHYFISKRKSYDEDNKLKVSYILCRGACKIKQYNQNNNALIDPQNPVWAFNRDPPNSIDGGGFQVLLKSIQYEDDVETDPYTSFYWPIVYSDGETEYVFVLAQRGDEVHIFRVNATLRLLVFIELLNEQLTQGQL